MPFAYRLVERVLFGSHRFAVPLQTVIQHALRGPRPASFLLDGHWFHCTTAHKYYFERSDYERDLWPVLQRSVAPNSVVYEIGAHFGFWVVRLANLARHIYAFEPSPANLDFLRRNVGGFPNVSLIEAAVGATATEVAFSENGSMGAVGAGALSVPMVTLDDFASRHELPNLLLMDVEGYGGEVLRGASALLAAHPTIFCEIHTTDEENAITAALTEHGYKPDYQADRYPFRMIAK
jgi:FkbM family methyltransferase